jgi:hypothetical protein
LLYLLVGIFWRGFNVAALMTQTLPNLTKFFISSHFFLADHNETNEEIELKILNETKHTHLESRVKRSVQNYHRLTPHEQQLQRHHQRQLQHQYELHLQREREREREREQRERQRTSQSSQQRSNTNTNHRDARRYQQMQQPPPQQHYNDQYIYRHDYQSSSHSGQHQKSDETKEYTIEVLVAVDKKMQEYHGKNLKNYVLTLMSVVSASLSITVRDAFL